MSFLTRHPIWLALAVAAVLSIQLVPHSTFVGDDYIQLGILEGTTEGFGAGPFDLYDFMDGSTEGVRRKMESGPVPWFVHPQLEVHFFRPVSSALLALDHVIFGLRPWGYRIQAIVWYLLIVAVYGAWLRLVQPAGDRGRDAGRTLGPAAVLAASDSCLDSSNWLSAVFTRASARVSAIS